MRDRHLRALAHSAVAMAAVLSLAGPGESRTNPDGASDSPAALPAAVSAEDACDDGMLAADDEASPKRLIGQVTALDHGAGRLVLATRTGPVELNAGAQTLGELAVGDVLVVEVTAEPDALASRGASCP
jgi:hypothetical protein